MTASIVRYPRHLTAHCFSSVSADHDRTFPVSFFIVTCPWSHCTIHELTPSYTFPRPSLFFILLLPPYPQKHTRDQSLSQSQSLSVVEHDQGLQHRTRE